jgi:pyruvate dehydrogenase E1 component
LAVERHNRLHPSHPDKVARVTSLLGGSTDPIVAVTDFMKIVPEQIARFVPGRLFTALGTDGMGRSDTREALRAHFEVDMPNIVIAVLASLAQSGSVGADIVEGAIAHYGLDPARTDPYIV